MSSQVTTVCVHTYCNCVDIHKATEHVLQHMNTHNALPQQSYYALVPNKHMTYCSIVVEVFGCIHQNLWKVQR